MSGCCLLDPLARGRVKKHRCKRPGGKERGWEGGTACTYLAGVGALVLVLPGHAGVLFVDGDGVPDHTGGAAGWRGREGGKEGGREGGREGGGGDKGVYTTLWVQGKQRKSAMHGISQGKLICCRVEVDYLRALSGERIQHLRREIIVPPSPLPPPHLAHRPTPRLPLLLLRMLLPK